MSYKIAVLMGGSSFERDFSLASGRFVMLALEAMGHEVLPLDTDANLVEALRREQPDLAFIALHGGHGEDGTIQALLEFLAIPFVGSTSSVCRMTWNKSMLPTVVGAYRRAVGGEKQAHWPRGICLSAYAFKDLGAAGALDLVTEHLPQGYPVAVLPAEGGSAMGVNKVKSASELAPALLDALSFDDEVLIEEWIEGTEIAVCVLGSGDEAYALPPIEISTQTEFFNVEARVNHDFVEYFVPARADSLGEPEQAAEIRAEIEAAALEVHKAFGCRDLSRVDLIWDKTLKQARVLEINVSPGMSEFSLFPTAANSAFDGGFAVLLERLLAMTMARK